MDKELISIVKEMEFDFENTIKALEGIIFNNPSAVFFDLVFIKYEENSTKKIAITKWNGSNSLRNFSRMLFKHKVFIKNLAKKENVYLAVTDKTKFLNFIWLDDIKLENISQNQLEYMTLIETSPNNYQCWIKLDKTYPENQIMEMKRYLVEKLQADKAAMGKIQPMRLPGFFSYKHKEEFLVRVKKISQKFLDGEKLLNKISKNTNAIKSNNNPKPTYKPKKDKKDYLKYSYYKNQLGYDDKQFNPLNERDVMIEFYKTQEKYEIDNNIIDINFVYQLLIRDYPKDKILDYLLKARADLDKKHDVNDYLERTYLKALIFSKKFENLNLYENKLLLEFLKELEKSGVWDKNKKVLDNLIDIAKNLS